MLGGSTRISQRRAAVATIDVVERFNMSEACLLIAIACGHDVRRVINTAQLLGKRSSSSELPTADLSAPAACHQLLLPGNATHVTEMLELPEQDGEELCRALQRLYPTSCGESFETLDQCAFAAEVMALGDVAECAASHTAWAEDTSGSSTNEFYLGVVSTLRRATMPPLRASVSYGESADESGLCSSDRDSECGDVLVQGKN